MNNNNLDNHAVLKLYFALCSAVTREGTINPNSTIPKEQDEYIAAIQQVVKAIDPAYPYYNFMILRDHSVVKSEEDSKKFINYAKDNLGKVDYFFELCHTSHGRTFFYKKLKLFDWHKNTKKGLVDKLITSGFEPVSIKYSNIDYIRDALNKKDSDGKSIFSNDYVKELEKKEFRLIRKLWKSYIYFT
jgi:hypothetical protein